MTVSHIKRLSYILRVPFILSSDYDIKIIENQTLFMNTFDSFITLLLRVYETYVSIRARLRQIWLVRRYQYNVS